MAVGQEEKWYPTILDSENQFDPWPRDRSVQKVTFVHITEKLTYPFLGNGDSDWNVYERKIWEKIREKFVNTESVQYGA